MTTTPFCYPQNLFARVTWIVLDSVGVGAMPDAAAYGDSGADTLGNIARLRPLHLPHLGRMGLGNLKSLPSIPAAVQPTAAFGRCTLASPGKDTTTGHWEMAGIHLTKPFPLYPHGFPREVLERIESRTGRSFLGNKPASGTEIIQELGEEHIRTGSPILYTSADSVFQVAAHEDVIPLWELYRICEIARGTLTGENEVGRVIARPFTGELDGQTGRFIRTANRKDFAVPPPKGMLLDQLEACTVSVYAIGKIFDVFLGRGIRDYTKTKNNDDGMAQTAAALDHLQEGLIFTNLVDFDQNFGHRNDVEGYAAALEAFDRWLPSFMERLGPSDLLILTADHGCDPTTASTDHTREYVPLLVFSPSRNGGADLGTRESLADIGQTVAANFGTHIEKGIGFLHQIV